jgi:hypothetical protein
MAFFFGDGFDLYTAITDCGGYWDGAFGATVSLALSSSGRFAGSRGLTIASAGSATVAYATKTSGVNDAVHHLSLAIQQTAAITGTSNYLWFTFYDGSSAQCSLVFRSDGALLLTSGASSGTALATYTGAVAAQNTWYQFEIEVVINNTTGSIAVRKNGNTSNDFSLGSLNTRAGSANNYANKLGVGATTATAGADVADDLLWRSDASSVAWAGDIRCFTRMPASDASVAWSRFSPPTLQQQNPNFSTQNTNLNALACFCQITPQWTGQIASVTVVAGITSGNLKVAIFADNSGVPGAVLAAPAGQAMIGGNNVFTLASPLNVSQAQKIWIGATADNTTARINGSTTSLAYGGTATVSYATFPQANPVTTTPGTALQFSVAYISPTSNAMCVSDLQQDGASSYVYSSTVGQSDLYAIAPIGSTPSTIVGVTTRAYCEKSDAGTRNLAVQLQSGATNVQSPSTALGTSWNWIARNDLVDPNTSAAWTPSGVNAAEIGVTVTA